MTTSPTPEELIALQDTLYASKNPTRRWLHQTRKRWIEDAIGRAGPGARALEIGPGSGVYLPALSASFELVTAMDIEAAYLEHLGPLHSDVHFVQDDITGPAEPSDPFDLVLCSEVVEHIPDSAAALRGMSELLRTGGRLILSTPQRYSPLELASKIAFLPGVVRVVRAIYREPILKQGHINLMTRRTVRRQLEDAGFGIEVEHLSGVYVPLMAEFTGKVGLGIARWLESGLRATPLSWTLWTQYYVAKKL